MWDYVCNFIKTLFQISDLAVKLRELEGQVVELRSQFTVGDFAAKIGNLERQLIELRLQVDVLAKSIEKIEGITNKLPSQRYPSHNTNPLPVKGKDFVHHKNLLWFKNDNTPYCPACFGNTEKHIPMQTIETSIGTTSRGLRSSKSLLCPTCKYETDITDPPQF